MNAPGQLPLFAPPVICPYCDGLGFVATIIVLRGATPALGARLDPCPECAGERELDPR